MLILLVGWLCLNPQKWVLVFLCALIALPDFLAEQRRAAERPAAQALQVVVQAEQSYAAAHPLQGFTCDLGQLQGTPNNLVSKKVLNAAVGGYRIELRDCTAESSGGRVQHFHAIALPARADRRAYCADESGNVDRSYSNRAEDCAQVHITR